MPLRNLTHDSYSFTNTKLFIPIKNTRKQIKKQVILSALILHNQTESNINQFCIQ